MMRGAVIACVLAITSALPLSAHAGTDDWLTVGLGASAGVLQSGDDVTRLSHELRAGVRLFRGLGAEVSYNPGGAFARGALVYDSILRMSALLYVLPTRPLGGYLKLGLGNQAFSRLTEWTHPSASYHGGVGLELHLNTHVALHSELLLLVPGVRSLGDSLRGEVDRVGPTRAADALRSLGDRLRETRTFRAMVGIMFFI